MTLLTAAALYLTLIQNGLLIIGLTALFRLARITENNLLVRLVRSRKTIMGFVFLTFVDTIFAALIIDLFIPPNFAPFSTIYLAFLLSFAIGLVSGLPGGFGPFEITMLMLLPGIDPTVLVPALIGFRIVYFAIPATLAVLFIGHELLLQRRAPVTSLCLGQNPDGP